jgi:hypothetical protein
MPVVSDKMAYLELQKTASTHIGSLFVDLFGAERRLPKHGLLPADCRDRFVVGSVRNPWDYYVSLWSFGGQGEGGLHTRLTQRRFRAARRALPRVQPLVRELTKPVRDWRSTYEAPPTPEKFRRWLDLVHTPARAPELEAEYGASTIRDVAGYATYRYCRLFAGDLENVLGASTALQLASNLEAKFLPDAIIRMEHLADDLLAAVSKAGYEIDPALESAVRARTRAPDNRSEHRPYVDYYDDASRELVAKRDAVIIERHEYVFGS